MSRIESETSWKYSASGPNIELKRCTVVKDFYSQNTAPLISTVVEGLLFNIV